MPDPESCFGSYLVKEQGTAAFPQPSTLKPSDFATDDILSFPEQLEWRRPCPRASDEESVLSPKLCRCHKVPTPGLT